MDERKLLVLRFVTLCGSVGIGCTAATSENELADDVEKEIYFGLVNSDALHPVCTGSGHERNPGGYVCMYFAQNKTREQQSLIRITKYPIQYQTVKNFRGEQRRSIAGNLANQKVLMESVRGCHNGLNGRDPRHRHHASVGATLGTLGAIDSGWRECLDYQQSAGRPFFKSNECNAFSLYFRNGKSLLTGRSPCDY